MLQTAFDAHRIRFPVLVWKGLYIQISRVVFVLWPDGQTCMCYACEITMHILSLGAMHVRLLCTFLSLCHTHVNSIHCCPFLWLAYTLDENKWSELVTCSGLNIKCFVLRFNLDFVEGGGIQGFHRVAYEFNQLWHDCIGLTPHKHNTWKINASPWSHHNTGISWLQTLGD